jgi:hypothetical protein
MTSTDPARLSAIEFLQALYGADAQGYPRLEHVGKDLSDSFPAPADPSGIVDAAMGSHALQVEFEALRYARADRWKSERMASKFLWSTVASPTPLDLALSPVLPTYIVVSRRFDPGERPDAHPTRDEGCPRSPTNTRRLGAFSRPQGGDGKRRMARVQWLVLPPSLLAPPAADRRHLARARGQARARHPRLRTREQ